MTELAVIQNHLDRMRLAIDSPFLVKAIVQVNNLGHELSEEYDKIEAQRTH